MVVMGGLVMLRAQRDEFTFCWHSFRIHVNVVYMEILPSSGATTGKLASIFGSRQIFPARKG